MTRPANRRTRTSSPAPGLFVDIVRDGKKTWLVDRAGIDARTIRTVLNREGVKAVVLDARDFDERRAVYASLAEATQGKAV